MTIRKLRSLFGKMEVPASQKHNLSIQDCFPLCLTASVCVWKYKIKALFLKCLHKGCFFLFRTLSTTLWGKEGNKRAHTSHPEEISTFPALFSSFVSWLFPYFAHIFVSIFASTFLYHPTSPCPIIPLFVYFMNLFQSGVYSKLSKSPKPAPPELLILFLWEKTLLSALTCKEPTNSKM